MNSHKLNQQYPICSYKLNIARASNFLRYFPVIMKTILTLIAVTFIPLLAIAQKKPGEAATIKKVEIKGAVKPSAEVTAEVHVELEKGYHSHSNKPSEPQFIPTVLELPPAAGVTAGKIDYPPGKSEKVEGLDKPLSVYEHEFVITAKLKLGSDAKLPTTVPAVLGYQACKGATCFRPQKLKFDITIPAGQ